MELTSCACVCVPVACETQLRLFDFVFPCVRVAVPPYIGFTVGMVVSRCCCIDLDPVTLEGCIALCAAYFSACISPSFVVPVRFGCVETAVSKKCSFFLGVCVCVFRLVCCVVGVSELASLRYLVWVQFRLWVVGTQEFQMVCMRFCSTTCLRGVAIVCPSGCLWAH